jgi:hypothetical protein
MSLSATSSPVFADDFFPGIPPLSRRSLIRSLLTLGSSFFIEEVT